MTLVECFEEDLSFFWDKLQSKSEPLIIIPEISCDLCKLVRPSFSDILLKLFSKLSSIYKTKYYSRKFLKAYRIRIFNFIFCSVSGRSLHWKKLVISVFSLLAFSSTFSPLSFLIICLLNSGISFSKFLSKV